MMAPNTLTITLTYLDKDHWEEAYLQGMWRAREGIKVRDLAFSSGDSSIWMHGFMAGYESIIQETH